MGGEPLRQLVLFAPGVDADDDLRRRHSGVKEEGVGGGVDGEGERGREEEEEDWVSDSSEDLGVTVLRHDPLPLEVGFGAEARQLEEEEAILKKNWHIKSDEE